MVCWKIGSQFSKLVRHGLSIFKVEPAKWSWSPDAIRYYKVSALSIMVVLVIMASVQIVYFHLFLQYQVGARLAESIKAMLDNQVGALFSKESRFIKQHFQQLTMTTQYYVDPLYTYFKVLVDRASRTEKRQNYRAVFKTWFLEILLLFLFAYMILFFMNDL